MRNYTTFGLKTNETLKQRSGKIMGDSKIIKRGSKREEEFWKVAKFKVYDYDAHGTQHLYRGSVEGTYAKKYFDLIKSAKIRWYPKEEKGMIYVHSNLIYDFTLPKGFMEAPSGEFLKKKKSPSKKAKKPMKKLIMQAKRSG